MRGLRQGSGDYSCIRIHISDFNISRNYTESVENEMNIQMVLIMMMTMSMQVAVPVIWTILWKKVIDKQCNKWIMSGKRSLLDIRNI